MSVAAIVVGLVAGIAVFALGSAVPPLSEMCPSTVYSADECHLTIDASMRRGLAAVHPVILAAHADPGPDRATGQLGHRDTVTFEMLGIPGPTTVKLFYDVGAHWGGEPDRSTTELAAWAVGVAVAVGLLVGAVVAGLVVVARRLRAPERDATPKS